MDGAAACYLSLGVPLRQATRDILELEQTRDQFFWLVQRKQWLHLVYKLQ